MNFKRPVYRNPRLLKASKGRPCSICGKENGTTVRAHYSGEGSHKLGKGMGIKGHDFASADLCADCHTLLDNHKLDFELYVWFFAIMETLLRDFEEGVIK